MNRPAPWQSIMAGVVDRKAFRVGGATVDPRSREASWRGGKHRLQPLTLKVLLVLASHRGDVVSRDQLVQLCWDGRIVGDDVINRAISLLRNLAESAGGFKIETIPRTGYRLTESAFAERAGNFAAHRRLGVAIVVGGIAIAATAGWTWLNRNPTNQGLPPTPVVYVAPFVAQDNDRLAKQIADTAPAVLSRMLSQSGFAIVHNAGFSGTTGGGNYIFSGRFRRTGNLILGTVQMVSVRDGSIAFAHDFSAPLERAADLPDRIGATAAAELAWTGAEMVLDPQEHLDPAVASELMSSMNLTIEDGDNLRAYQMARHAAGLAKSSAMAQLTLAIQTNFSISSIPTEERAEALEAGRRAADRARLLAPQFGDVYLTGCLLHSPVRMIECDRQAHHALEVDPRSSFVPGLLSELYYGAGRVDEALRLARQSLANDPYKPAKMARMIRMLEMTGHDDEAEQIFQEATRLYPDSGRMRASRIKGLAERGDYSALSSFVDPAADSSRLDSGPLKALLAAQKNNDRSGVQQVCASKPLKPFTLGVCMTVLADLGDENGAFDIASNLYPAWHASPQKTDDRVWLENPKGFDTALLSGPAARAMRKDARFLQLARQLGLIAYWRKKGLPDFCQDAKEPVCRSIRSGQS